MIGLKLKNKLSILKRLLVDTVIQEEAGCWLWTGYCLDCGYGQVKVQGKNYLVHRLSLYIHALFDLQGGLDALHKIECPNKNCWNPEHLYAGTDCDNQRDAVKTKKNNNTQKTHCPAGHPYNKRNTCISNGRRHCRACARIRANQ